MNVLRKNFLRHDVILVILRVAIFRPARKMSPNMIRSHFNLEEFLTLLPSASSDFISSKTFLVVVAPSNKKLIPYVYTSIFDELPYGWDYLWSSSPSESIIIFRRNCYDHPWNLQIKYTLPNRPTRYGILYTNVYKICIQTGWIEYLLLFLKSVKMYVICLDLCKKITCQSATKIRKIWKTRDLCKNKIHIHIQIQIPV